MQEYITPKLARTELKHEGDLNKLIGQMPKMRAQMHLDEPAPKVDDLNDEM